MKMTRIGHYSSVSDGAGIEMQVTLRNDDQIAPLRSVKNFFRGYVDESTHQDEAGLQVLQHSGSNGQVVRTTNNHNRRMTQWPPYNL